MEQAPETYRAPVHFSVLGSLHVENGNGRVEIPGVKERTLLAHLIARVGQMVPAADLVDSLWGEAPPRTASKALQTYVLRLRNVLEPDRGGLPRLLVTDGPGYRLEIDEHAVDARRFETLLGLAHRSLAEGQHEGAEDLLGQALALWRGPAYAGFEAAAFAQAEAQRLEELRLTAMEDRWTAQLDVGRAGAVVSDVERFVREHPLRERAWGLLILGLYRGGRQGEALKAYDRVRSVLVDELDVDPGPELRTLQRRVLAQDPGWTRPVGRRCRPVCVTPTTPILGRERRARHAACCVAPGPARRRRDRGGERALRCRRDEAGGGSWPERSRGTVPRSSCLLCRMRSPAPPDGKRPRLVVADHVPVPHGGPGCLVVALGPLTANMPETAELIDLGPLDDASVSRITEQYLGAADPGALSAGPGRVRGLAGPGPRGGGGAGAPHRDAAGERGVAHRAAVQRRPGAGPGRPDRRRPEVRRDLAAPAYGPDRRVPVEGARELRHRRRGVVRGARAARGRAGRPAGRPPSGRGGGRLGQRQVVGDPGGAAGGAGRRRAARLEHLAPDRDAARSPPDAELARQALGTRQVEIGDLLAHMVRDSAAVDDARVVVVVDQLEEVWTAWDDEAERAAFLDVLADLAADPGSGSRR